ncbi:MAG: tetratricopeptide repeat protein [Candidatus Sulfotelmatobacter sp.]|jgi:tetratricopeptide (TPR) repeat protein
MKIRDVAVLFWAVLCLGVLSCFSQSSPSREQQIELHNRKAGEYLRQNRPDLAVPEFKAILDLDPKNVDAHGNLGTVVFFQGDYTNAIPQLRAALKLRPTLWRTAALLGMAEKRTGDVDGAKHDLEKAFANLTEEKVRTETGMELIEIYSRSGDLDKAASIIAILKKLNPTDPNVLYSAYRLYSDLADESLLSLSVVAPKSARMHQALAHELAERGNTAEAIENYRAAIKLDPQIPGIHFELAEMLNVVDTPESKQEAEAEYKAAIQANPFDEQSECRLGDLALRANDLKTASEDYTKAVQLQPNDPEANIGLAKVMMALDQRQKAEALLQHAIQADPTNAVAHFRLSTIYRESGRFDEAKQEIEEYQKYNKMKEQLRELFRDLHRSQTRNDDDSSM